MSKSELLVSRSAFADAAKCSAATVTTHCKKALASAVVGKSIDATHPAAEQWLRERRVDPAAARQYLRQRSGRGGNKGAPPAPSPAGEDAQGPTKGWGRKRQKEKRQAAGEASDVEIPDYLESFADYTIREAVERWGTDVRMADFLRAVKEMEQASHRRIQNEQLRGKLVPKELIERHVFGLIENAFSRLLNDTPRTLVGELLEAHDAGESREKITDLARELMSQQIRGIKKKAQKGLRDAQRG